RMPSSNRVTTSIPLARRGPTRGVLGARRTGSCCRNQRRVEQTARGGDRSLARSPRPVIDRGWAQGRPTQPCFPKVTLAAALPLSPESTTRTLFRGRRDLPFVEAAFDHGVGFAHQKVGRDLVLGAAKLA